MARSRFAKPEFFDDPVLARCSHPARLLFVATWQVADRCGVFEWDPARLRKYAFGYEDITTSNVSEMLAELVAGGFVRWADVGGKRYGLVVNLAKHQKFHVAEQARFENVAKQAKWKCEHPASTLLAPCQNPFPLRPSLETETETETEISEAANDEVESRPALTLAPPKPRKAKTPSAPVADAPGFAEATDLWFKAYRAYYGTAPQWGAVNGRKIKELLSQANIEELRELIPHFFAWARPEVIKGGHSLWKGHSSLIAKLDELRADLARPQRRAVAAVVQERERQSDHEVAQDDQATRVAKLVREKLNGNGSNARAIGAGHASPRDVQQAAIGPRAVDVGAGTPALRRAGASAVAEQRDPCAEDAEPWGGDLGDAGAEAGGDGSEA